MSTVEALEITEAERDRLIELESMIFRAFSKPAPAGAALVEIRDAELYREHHLTFESYCKHVWGLDDARVCYLVAAAQVRAIVRPPETSEREWTIVPRTEPVTPSAAPELDNEALDREYRNGYRAGALNAWALAFPIGAAACAIVVWVGSGLMAGI